MVQYHDLNVKAGSEQLPAFLFNLMVHCKDGDILNRRQLLLPKIPVVVFSASAKNNSEKHLYIYNHGRKNRTGTTEFKD